MKTFKEYLQERVPHPFAVFALQHPNVLAKPYWFGVQWACQDAGLRGHEVIESGRDLWVKWSNCRSVTEMAVDLKRGGKAIIPPHEVKRRLPDLFLVGHDRWCWGFNDIGKRRASKLIRAAITDYLGEPIKPGWVPFMDPILAIWRREPKVELGHAASLVDQLFPGTKDPFAVFQALEESGLKYSRQDFEAVRK